MFWDAQYLIAIFALNVIKRRKNMTEIIAGVVVFLIVIIAVINIDLDGAREYLKNLRNDLKK